MNPSVPQTSYRLLCEGLRRVLAGAVESGPSAVGTIHSRAVAALYELLLNHPVDRRGRCRSCRRPGAVLGRARRRCRVRMAAAYWLHQPERFLLVHVARELGLPVPHPAPPLDAGAVDRCDDAEPPAPGRTLLVLGGAPCPS